MLIANDLFPIRFDDSPVFLKAGDITVGIVAYSVFPKEGGAKITAGSMEMKQKLKLAGQLSDLVVIYVHWGIELQDWASPAMYEEAEKLIAEGAGIIVGAHPHVVIKNECVSGKPVFFSIGNHVFDQKYPISKRGLLPVCEIRGDDSVDGRMVECHALNTVAARGSYFPEIENAGAAETKASAPAGCPVPLRKPREINGITIRAESVLSAPGEVILTGRIGKTLLWKTVPSKIISISSGKLSDKSTEEFLFTVEEKYSDIDRETAPRPYVYNVSKNGLTARWRGSALAWPLVDASVICADSCFLCALHRGDSFLIPDPSNKDKKVFVYHWNGFGFSSVQNKNYYETCEKNFGLPGNQEQ